MGCAQVAGKHYPLALPCLRIIQIDFHIGGTNDMAGPLQADTRVQFVGIYQREPMLIRQSDEAAFNNVDVTLDTLLVAAEAQLEGIFKNDGQEFCRSLAAKNRPIEDCSQQIGNTPDMVDVYMGYNKRLDGIQRKVDQ